MDRLGVLTVSVAEAEVRWQDQRICLTRTEFKVLEKLTQRCGWFSRPALEQYCESIDTYGSISSYVHRIRRKIHYNVIDSQRGYGYRISPSVIVHRSTTERSTLLTRNDAELYIKLSKTSEVPESFRDSLLRVAFSKRFRIPLRKTLRISLWRYEEDAVQSVRGVPTEDRPLFSWSINQPEQYWPLSLQPIEVVGLQVDGQDITTLLTAREGANGEKIFECDYGEGDSSLRSVRVDVRSFHWVQGDRAVLELYPPEADRVVLRFDGSQAGFNTAWVEGGRIAEHRPFVWGPDGAGTVEAVLLQPDRHQHISIIAVVRETPRTTMGPPFFEIP